MRGRWKKGNIDEEIMYANLPIISNNRYELTNDENHQRRTQQALHYIMLYCRLIEIEY